QGINISFEELGRTPTLSNWWSLVDARQRIAG
ncbi:isochorismatase, partial [Acinetobacter baumannii]|nr:isochorismatase [Acinetobacter baumannii]